MKLKKNLGQNFLKNEIIALKISNYILPKKSENLLEIGCGAGALTKFLITENWKNYQIVEIDNFWANEVKKNFSGIKVFCKNILDFELIKNKENWNIIGNIPYNITFEILNKIIEWKDDLEKVVFMVQNEVAEKLHKKNGKNFGPISVLIQLFFEIELLYKIYSREFTPKPKVNSRIIRLIPIKNRLIINKIEDFKKFLSILFKQPRKMIRNNIIGTKYQNLIKEEFLNKRAQELFSEKLLILWNEINF